MIRLANTSDIESVLDITEACALHMIENGILDDNDSKYNFRKQLIINELRDGCLCLIQICLQADWLVLKHKLFMVT